MAVSYTETSSSSISRPPRIRDIASHGSVTRLERRAVEGLARRFGIGDPTTFSVMDGGLENTSYCIETSSERYVLTVWDQKSLQQATSLANLLVYLIDQGIRTSRVVVSPVEPIVILHDKKPVMLKRYIDGDVTPELTGNILVQLGEEMARLHGISAPPYVPRSFPYGRRCFSEVINSNQSHSYLGWLSRKISYLKKEYLSIYRWLSFTETSFSIT